MALANWQLGVWFIMLDIYMTVCQVIHHRLLVLIGSIKVSRFVCAVVSIVLVVVTNPPPHLRYTHISESHPTLMFIAPIIHIGNL